MKTYYYEQAGQQAGPIAGELLRTHGVEASTLVWHEGMADWAPAASLAELTAFFQPVPPPLPKRPGPPPLPSPISIPGAVNTLVPVATVPSPAQPDVTVSTAPVAVLEASTLSPTSAPPFATSGYSVPQLGVFKGDTAIYSLETGELVASFAENADLERVYKDGLWYNETYRFLLLDPAGELLLKFYKPAKGIMQALKHELHIVNAQNQLLGICRNKVTGFNLSGKIDNIITVTDTYSQTLLELDSCAELKFHLTIELVQRGGVVGTILGSKGSGGVSRALFVYARDRFELQFKPEADTKTKAIGLGALLALHLFVRHRWR